ncbi:MAG: 7-carboxy-7-deazaguanine synthase [Planctomycetota bacterium]|jgi:7-carboxy-7-deazaguanine synthase (Cx14CxxC type)
MAYAVKEIFYSLQGEGAHTGRPAVFCRFSGCNLWSGEEEDRSGAICRFCDTDFVGGDGPNAGTYDTDGQLVATVSKLWSPKDHSRARPFVVCTGGEPTLQMNERLVAALHEAGFEVAVETNGTRTVPPGVDWICVSPKAKATLRQTSGNELKLVFPQEGAEPELYESLDFDHFFLQPMDSPRLLRNMELALRYCLDHPRWHLSLQTQKVFGDPSNEPKLLSLMAYAPPEDVELLLRRYGKPQG